VTYVDEREAERLRDELMQTRLATYRYRHEGGQQRHLGFIIEDMPPGSPAVLSSRERVDLYGFVSMTVAALQQQQKELDGLRKELAQLKSENARLRKASR
jgi:hypothetical protein